MKGRERMGSSLPPAKLATRDSALFEKMKCIFSIAPVGNLEKSRVCSSQRNTHRTLAFEAPDAEAERPVCCSCVRCYLTSVGVFDWKHRNIRDRPVVSVRCAGVLQPSLRMGPVSTGR